MTIDTNLDNCIKKELVPIQSASKKGWGYSFVYNLRDLRDIYLLLSQNIGRSIQELLDICKKYNLISESGKDWTARNLLEIVNAWINFGYVRSIQHGYIIIRQAEFNSDVNMPLDDNDKKIFLKIYFEYYKFKEFHSLFSTNRTEKRLDGFVYAFSQGIRFVNNFFVPRTDTLWTIDNSHKDMMRFWDVYTSWGIKLNVLDKLNLFAFDIMTIDERLRNSNMIYYVNEMSKDFSIIEYIKNTMSESYLSIISIERQLVWKYHFKIDDIKNRIVKECEHPNSSYRMQSTSSNFIRRNDHRYYPMVNNTYISHLLKV